MKIPHSSLLDKSSSCRRSALGGQRAEEL